MTTNIDTRQAIESLRSKTCPACGKAKKARQTLCYPCYRRLPHDQKGALYDGVGEGYEEAVQAAFDTLRVTEPVWESAHAR